MRRKKSDKMEHIIKSFKSMVSTRKAADINDSFKTDLTDSLEPVKSSLNSLFEWLSLKQKNFMIGSPAYDNLNAELWQALRDLDDTGIHVYL